MPPIRHGRVGDSIDVFSVRSIDGSAGTYRPASDAEDETEDVDYYAAQIRGERTYGSQDPSVDQAG